MNDKDLTVDAKNSTVNNSATTTGTITITDVSNATWNEFAKGNTILFKDSDKDAHFVVKKDGEVKKLTVTSPTAKVENEGIIKDLSVAKDSIVTLEGNVPVDATGEGKIRDIEGNEVKTEAEEQKEAERKAGTRLALPEAAKSITTNDILFQSIRIVEDKGNNQAGSQVAVTAETLVKAFTTNTNTGLQGKNHAGTEVNAAVVGTVVEANGLTIGLKVENGDLLLGNTKMTKTLFNAIKEQDSADKTKPYSITVTNGKATNPKTKVAKIEFTLVGEEVVAKLVAVN